MDVLLDGGLGAQSHYLLLMLQLRPGMTGFMEMVLWCAEVDREAARFWAQARS